MKVLKIMILSITAIIIFMFLFGIIHNLGISHKETERIISANKEKSFDYVEYISNYKMASAFETFSKASKVENFEGFIFTKIKKINNEYAVLAYGTDENYLVFFDEDIEIKRSFLIERGNVRFYDFGYFDKEYIFVGEKNQKPYYLKTSDTGSHLSSNSISSNGRYNVVKALYEGFIMAGYVIENGVRNAYINKINMFGDRIWDKRFGRNNNEEIKDIVVTLNEYIFVGTTNSNPTKVTNTLILKYSIDGINIFDGVYGTDTHNEHITVSFLDEESKLYFAGYVETLDSRNWKSLFVRTVEDIQNEGIVVSEIRETRGIQNLSRIEDMKYKDGNIYKIGFSVESWPDYDGFLRISNKNGYVIEQRIYGSNNEERIYSFEFSDDGGIIMVGYQKNENKNIPLIIKTDNFFRIPEFEK